MLPDGPTVPHPQPAPQHQPGWQQPVWRPVAEPVPPTTVFEPPPEPTVLLPPERVPLLRRGVGGSAVAGLLLGLPWFLVSLAIVTQLATSAGGRGWGIVLSACWLLSGIAVFIRPVESVVAMALFRFRRPTPAERQLLGGPWAEVLDAAGIDHDAYELWVQNSRDVNAYASAGHIVAVTTTALRTLPPQQLSAVLAHELGHHLRGEAWISMLMYWYSLPGRAVVRLLTVALRLIGRVAGAVSAVSWLGVLVGLGLLFLLVVVVVVVSPALLVLLLVTPLAAYFARRDELRADRIAATLGFGRPMLGALYGWLHAGHDRDRRRWRWRDQLLATHPPLTERIKTLERYLAKP